jgi:hypothetical protein
MALTQLNENCLVCGETIPPESTAWFLGMVEATKTGRTGAGEAGASFGGGWSGVKDGKLRIRHKVGGKPRGLICPDCVSKVFNK